MGLILRQVGITAGMGLLPIAPEESDDFTATKGFITPVNATNKEIVVTPPSNPIADDRFGIVDSRAKSSTHKITIDFGQNDQLIHGSLNTFVVNQDSALIIFRFLGLQIGWVTEK